MTKNTTRFIRITDQDRCSIHDDIPILEPRDQFIRLEIGSEGKIIDSRPVQFAGSVNVEPTFTLRAADQMAVPCVGVWIAIAEASGAVEMEKIINAKATFDAMKIWKPRQVKT